MNAQGRTAQVLAILRSAAGPMSGEELARLLGVTTRRVRHFVRELNDRAGGDLIRSSRLGYSLDQSVYERATTGDALDDTLYETPQQRLFTTIRRLVANPGGTDIFELADELAVSEATVEADLVRARELLRHNDLVLRRERNRVRVEGGERQQRRLMRQIVINSSEGLTPAALQAFAADYAGYDLTRLRQGVLGTFDSLPVELNEYVLNDVLIHLTIAADRVRHGHTVDPPELDQQRIDELTYDIVTRLSAVVEQAFGLQLPPGERRALYGLLMTRLNRRSDLDLDPAIIDPYTMAMVRDAIADLSDQYLLEMSDESTTVNLALHVQNLLARANSGQALRNPLGADFKNQHPLIHELAVYFAHKIEAKTGITVSEGELDFLSFHLGTQFQRQLDSTTQVRITLVIPRYHDTHRRIESSLRNALGDQAAIEQVVTTLDYDWRSIDSDLIVSAVSLAGNTNVPVITISPLLPQEDIDDVQQAVRRERGRAERAKIRSATATLMDPEFFLHIAQVDTKEEALAIMCHQLLAADVVHDSFYDDVLDREQRSSTAFGGSFAIPHSMFMDARRTAIAVLVTDRPIPWGTSSVRLVMLFALSPDSRQLFRDVLDKLTNLLAEPATTSRLLAASGSHSEFITALAELLQN